MKWITAILLLLATSPLRAETCLASVYGTKDADQNGTGTASGIPLRDNALTMAHKTYTMKGFMKITNLKTGKVVVLQVIDRGPYVVGRCADITHEAAKQLGVPVNSLTKVAVEGVNK